MLFYSLQSLTDVGGHSRVNECNAPVVNIAVQQLHFLPTFGENEIVGEAFVVVEKVVLEGVRSVAQAQNEVFVAVMGVILHHVPEYRPIPNRDHWLRNLLRILSEPHSQSTTKQHDFHSIAPSAGGLIPAATGLDSGLRLAIISRRG